MFRKNTTLYVQVADRRDPPDGPLQGASDSSIGRRHHDWGGSGGHQHHICSLVLVFIPPFRSLLLTIMSNFQITKSIMVLSKFLSGCFYKSLLVCLPQRAVWCFWSLQYHFGGKPSLLINLSWINEEKKLWKLGNCKRVDFTSGLKFIWQMKYAWNWIIIR